MPVLVIIFDQQKFMVTESTYTLLIININSELHAVLMTLIIYLILRHIILWEHVIETWQSKM